MLITLWLRLGAFLARLLLWSLVLGVLGWALASAWLAWQHRGPVSAQELIADDEAAMTQDIIQTAVRIVDQHRESTRYLRDAHAKAHGCVKAEVQVLPNCARVCSASRAKPGKRQCACPTAMPTRSSTASATPGAWRSNCSMCRASNC